MMTGPDAVTDSVAGLYVSRVGAYHDAAAAARNDTLRSSKNIQISSMGRTTMPSLFVSLASPMFYFVSFCFS